MRALVTGAGGFAGRHLVAHLQACGDELVGLERGRVELLDAAAVAAWVAESAPDVVYHLAAQASVARSWSEPRATIEDNAAMALHLLDAVRAGAPDAVVVAVASGELYGPPAALPVDETAPLRPQNPYAVSKATADLLAGFYADAHGLRVVRARPFNHAGPGQSAIYAIASFARQVARGLETGAVPVRIETGNPKAGRDYTDVRDVVRAYRLLAVAAREDRVAPGAVFNVCSGVPADAELLVRRLGELAGVAVEHVVDPGLVRAHEVLEVRGSAAALAAATGWAPERSLDDTLRDAVAWWRAHPGA